MTSIKAHQHSVLRNKIMGEQISKVTIKFKEPITMTSNDVLNLTLEITIKGKEIKHGNLILKVSGIYYITFNPSRRDSRTSLNIKFKSPDSGQIEETRLKLLKLEQKIKEGESK